MEHQVMKRKEKKKPSRVSKLLRVTQKKKKITSNFFLQFSQCPMRALVKM